MPDPFEISTEDLEAGESAALALLNERFGTAESGRELFQSARREGWIGRRLADLPLAAPAPFKVRLRWPASALDVEPGGAFVPAHLNGILAGSIPPEPVDLAIAVNGRIAAVTANWAFKTSGFSAIVDPDVFQPGVNRIETIALMPGPDQDRPILRPVPPEIEPPIAGMHERGLHGVEDWPEGPIRWTDGDAEITVPIHRSRPPHALRLTVIGIAPNGTRLRILANGARLFDARLKPLKQGVPWSKVFDLAGIAPDDRLKIEIESDTFVPAEQYQGSTDERRLGVAILGFELLED